MKTLVIFSTLIFAVFPSSSHSNHNSLKAAASIQQPFYSPPPNLFHHQASSPPHEEYNSILPPISYGQSNHALGDIYSLNQQQQQNNQILNSQQPQPLSYSQYNPALQNRNPNLEVSTLTNENNNNNNEKPVLEESQAGSSNSNSDGSKQSVVIHKHIHMHYFVRGAELPELPPVPEEKTFVYFLLKKPDGPPSIVFPTQMPPKPTKPEVYFIQYKDPKKKGETSNLQSQKDNAQKVNSGDINLPIQNQNQNHVYNDELNTPLSSSQYGARIAKPTS